MVGVEETIIRWLESDKDAPRKQRHTAKRIFDRLVAEEGFEGSYLPVQRFVKKCRQSQQSNGGGFMELEREPGTAQVDFGQADAIIAGDRKTLHALVMTFPFSNMRLRSGLPW